MQPAWESTPTIDSVVILILESKKDELNISANCCLIFFFHTSTAALKLSGGRERKCLIQSYWTLHRLYAASSSLEASAAWTSSFFLIINDKICQNKVVKVLDHKTRLTSRILIFYFLLYYFIRDMATLNFLGMEWTITGILLLMLVHLAETNIAQHNILQIWRCVCWIVPL